MKSIKKIAVFLPVLLVGCKFLYSQYAHQYEQANARRLIMLILAIVLFYAWVAIGIIRRKQNSGFDLLLQSSFYVYIFGVLSLTGYFIFFNQVSSHDWWGKMIERVNNKDGVSFDAFKFLKGRHLLRFETVGNFIMLLPLGIYLPLLYTNLKNFFTVTFVAFLVSVSIELMQLITNVRITDVDDVILNTSGASAGFILYYIFFRLIVNPTRQRDRVQMYS